MSKSPSPPDSPASEWVAAREVLRYFDEKLYDLRKYSFSLIAALLIAQGLLLPFVPLSPGVSKAIETTTSVAPGTHSIQKVTNTNVNGSKTTSETIADAEPTTTQTTKMTNTTTTGGSPDLTKTGFPYPVKIAVLAGTLVLVIAVKWLDGNYQGLQRGAAIRAKVLERLQNLELTDEIALRYDVEGGQRQIRILHYGFEAALVILSILLLPVFSAGTIRLDRIPALDSIWTVDLLLVIGLAISALAEGVFYYFFVSPEHSRGPLPTEWAIERLQCKNGDQVRIMTTNIQKSSFRSSNIRHLNCGEIVWDILNNELISIFDKKNHPGKMPSTVLLMPGQSHVWTWNVQVPKTGTYHLCVDMDTEGVKLLYQELRKQHPFGRFWKQDQQIFNAPLPPVPPAVHISNDTKIPWPNYPGRLLSRKFQVLPNKPEGNGAGPVLDGMY